MMNKRGFLCTLAASLAMSANAAEPVVYKDISWAALVPKGWDPRVGTARNNPSIVGRLSDSNPAAQQLLQELRDTWDNAPLVPDMDGATVRMPGYVVPLESGKDGMSEFLLVPYFGACIHTPPPPANQIVTVVLATPVKGFKTMDAVWVSGTLKTDRQQTEMGVAGYRMTAVTVSPYSSAPRK